MYGKSFSMRDPNQILGIVRSDGPNNMPMFSPTDLHVRFCMHASADLLAHVRACADSAFAGNV